MLCDISGYSVTLNVTINVEKIWPNLFIYGNFDKLLYYKMIKQLWEMPLHINNQGYTPNIDGYTPNIDYFPLTVWVIMFKS